MTPFVSSTTLSVSKSTTASIITDSSSNLPALESTDFAQATESVTLTQVADSTSTLSISTTIPVAKESIATLQPSTESRTSPHTATISAAIPQAKKSTTIHGINRPSNSTPATASTMPQTNKSTTTSEVRKSSTTLLTARPTTTSSSSSLPNTSSSGQGKFTIVNLQVSVLVSQQISNEVEAAILQKVQEWLSRVSPTVTVKKRSARQV
ncbi:uncharacterized protein LOC114645474 [Erpetoichthys calabaricus]|uniref:uncharacterized protein LOC114645474 n=1 Tax=Erpetoichthys calabaricus TaxID=27687 RepID=UPI0022347EF6|nr:uncharacterized protein LOC114645474 [Erpetoichthys calabaricus]